MRIVIYGGTGHQCDWLYSGLQGFKKHGLQPLYTTETTPIGCDLAVFWSARKRGIIQAQKKHEKDFLIFERGYFNDRYNYTSIGFNGLNRNALFYNSNMDSKRWNKHGVPVGKWKVDGKYIIIAGQIQGDMSCEGVNLKGWYTELVKKLRDLGFNDEIRFKPHPLARQDSSPPGVKKVATWEGARWVLAYNSNSLTDAAIAGIPAIGFDSKAMAWDVIEHSLSALSWAGWTGTERTQWLYNLAYTQWTKKEIEKGDFWDHLKVRYS